MVGLGLNGDGSVTKGLDWMMAVPFFFPSLGKKKGMMKENRGCLYLVTSFAPGLLQGRCYFGNYPVSVRGSGMYLGTG